MLSVAPSSRWQITQIGVHHLDIARHGDVAGLDFGRAGRGELEALRPFALHADRDLLHVEHDVGHVLAHAGQRARIRAARSRS